MGFSWDFNGTLTVNNGVAIDLPVGLSFLRFKQQK